MLLAQVCCTPCEYSDVMASATSHWKTFFHATVIGKLTYCAPAWHGFCSSADYVRLESFLRRCAKLGYVERSATVTGMFLEAADALFRRILYNETHVLHTFLPERPLIVYSLRTKTHNKSLIWKTSDLNERNFIVRSLYKNCYWLLFHLSAF